MLGDPAQMIVYEHNVLYGLAIDGEIVDGILPLSKAQAYRLAQDMLENLMIDDWCSGQPILPENLEAQKGFRDEETLQAARENQLALPFTQGQPDEGVPLLPLQDHTPFKGTVADDAPQMESTQAFG